MVATNEFVTEIAAGVSERLGNGYEVTTTQTDKGNSVILDGIDIKPIGSEISAVVYVSREHDVEENVNRIVKAFNDMDAPMFDVELFEDYEKAKERLYLRLSSHPADGVVKKKAFCDLYITAAISMGGGASAQVRENHLKLWGISKAKLFKDARYYAEINMPACTMNLVDVITKRLGLPDFMADKMFPEEVRRLTILTNKDKVYGASTILYADGLPREFYMLPSSVHEVIIMPADDNLQNIRDLSEMVRTVNRDELDREDILANHAYHYFEGEWEIIDFSAKDII